MGSRNGAVIEVHAGETVYTAAGEWHWHGATPDRFMQHLAIWEAATDAPESEWGEHVPDEEYSAGT
jgi:quercetin dioxygenase-like cupin family protein